MNERNRGLFEAAFHGWPRRPTIDSAVTLYFSAMAGLVITRLSASAVAAIFPSARGMAVSFAFQLMYYAAFVLVPIGRHMASHPGTASGLWLTLPRVRPLVLTLLACVSGVFLCDNLGTLWLITLEKMGLTLQGAAGNAQISPLAQGMRFLVLALVPGVCEELLFRGVLMSAWSRRGRKCALLVSTVLFAMSHGSLEALPGQLVIGCAMGIAVLASGSLITAMTYHALHNALVLVLPGVSGGAQAAIASGQTLLGFIGGGHGVWMLLMRTLAFLAVFGGLLYTIWQLRAPTKAETTDKTPLGTQTLIVLAAGIVTACCLYFINFLTLLGVL